MMIFRPFILGVCFLAVISVSAQRGTVHTLKWYSPQEDKEAPVRQEPLRERDQLQRQPAGRDAQVSPERGGTRTGNDRVRERANDRVRERATDGVQRTVPPERYPEPPVTKMEVEPFEGAFIDPDKGGLPFFKHIIPLAHNSTSFSAHLVDPQYQTLEPAEAERWGGGGHIGPEPEMITSMGWYQKRPQALVSIYPFRRNSGTGQLEKLTSFRLELVETRDGGPQGMPKNYPASSKLATGEWFRFMVGQDGVYRITHSFLQELGVDVSSLASDQINIYGNHHGMLPFANNVERPTDLLINAIQVNDGGDGQFGPGDEILFYATGPQRWEVEGGRFIHTKNVFTDSASYFIGIGVDPPHRSAPAALANGSPTRTVTAFDDHQFLEKDVVNLLKSGRTWYGETFDMITTHNFSFNTPNLTGDTILLEFDGIARTIGFSNSSYFNVTIGNVLNENVVVNGVPDSHTGVYARDFHHTFKFVSSGNSIPVTITFHKHNPITSLGWMNYLRLNCRRMLRMSGDQMAFQDLQGVAPGEVSEFVLDLAQGVHGIWEITDPTNVAIVPFTDNGGQKVFRVHTQEPRRFMAFRNSGYLTPTKVGRVPNQDLHATHSAKDLVIVVPPAMRQAAQRLADRRMNEGLDVVMVSPQEVYNEFSSGARDATAIKRYMRMLYDRSGGDPALMPRNLLLFGDGSFNNFSIGSGQPNYLPSYQTENSLDPKKSYTSDDYFGLLDENEGEATGDLMDIGVGRLPVSSLSMANEVVNKILNHDRLLMLTATGDVCSTTGDGGLADWRGHVLFTSDDQDGDGFEGAIHMNQSDFLARRVETEHPDLNVGKIYLDAYQQISTPGGQRYPQAAQDFRERVQKGLLLVNYIGHGGEVGWAHERFLDNNTILGWSNSDRLPVFMTATCEFSRWDDPVRVSAGEYVLINPNGGAVALLSTTRLAFSDQNFQLSQKFYDHAFERNANNGGPQTLGDIFRETKRAIAVAQANLYNHRNFSLLGDPSQRLALPNHTIQITSITDTLGAPVETLEALGTVRVNGFVDDGSGQPLQDFNGLVIPTVYDKELAQSTLANDGGTPFNFKIRKNIIYRGKASVVNGQFSFTFVVPKDINYQLGPGRISCYAESWNTNAIGHDNEVEVGGTSADAAMDESGPRIELYMNDENFVRGGMTNEAPLLFAKLYDENGINTVGSSIGHDLLATLNDNSEQAVVLNDLYEADLDTYRSGTVRYRFKELPEGGHTLRLKAWDVFNNSSETTTEFVVASSAELALAHVLNYPNPFTTYTQFLFEHNRPCTTLNVQVQVFTVSGRLVKTLSRQMACQGFRAEPLAWDGRDDHGDKLGRGVYVYRLNVTTPEGDKAEKFEKLVILR